MWFLISAGSDPNQSPHKLRAFSLLAGVKLSPRIAIYRKRPRWTATLPLLVPAFEQKRFSLLLRRRVRTIYEATRLCSTVEVKPQSDILLITYSIVHQHGSRLNQDQSTNRLTKYEALPSPGLLTLVLLKSPYLWLWRNYDNLLHRIRLHSNIGQAHRIDDSQVNPETGNTYLRMRYPAL